MRFQWPVFSLLIIQSLPGCAPPVPTLPEFAVFPAGSGNIEVRKTLGGAYGDIGHSRYAIPTSIVYVREDGSEVELPIRPPSYHQQRADTVVIREVRAPTSGWSASTESDIYVDSRILDRAEFDQIVQCCQENRDAIESAYVWMPPGYGDPNAKVTRICYYESSMFQNKYYWSENPGVYISLWDDSTGGVELSVPLAAGPNTGPCRMLEFGQILTDGQQMLLCDIANLSRHALYSPSFRKAFQHADVTSILDDFVDSQGRRLTDHFDITSVPVEGSELRFRAEAEKFNSIQPP